MKREGTIVITPIATTLGVLLGGIVWLAMYASRFGSIEFDGPASLGLLLGLTTGGIVGGLIGVMLDMRRRKKFAKTFAALVSMIIIATAISGLGLGMYAQNKWDYPAAHKLECSASEDTRPLACG